MKLIGMAQSLKWSITKSQGQMGLSIQLRDADEQGDWVVDEIFIPAIAIKALITNVPEDENPD